MFRITISRRGSPEHVFDLRDRLLRIGRGAGNEILLRDPDKTVSRNHARIIRSGDGFVYVDHESQNGSWVNGQVVDRVALVDGLTITIGEYELRCETRQVVALGPDEETLAAAGGAIVPVALRVPAPAVVPLRAAAIPVPKPRRPGTSVPTHRGAGVASRHDVAHVASQPDAPTMAVDRPDDGLEPTGH